MGASRNKKVLLAMSGGVDSSVAAVLLREQDFDVVGVFMRLGSDDSVQAADGVDELLCDPALMHETSQGGKTKLHHQGCCSLNDAADARLVAATLDIPLYIMNFKQDFGRIIDYFVDEYNRGRTPNPCIRCNQWLKFGKLLDYARSIDADYVATGHYARLGEHQGKRLIRQAVSSAKDQSYVLFGIEPAVLDAMLLPIGEYEKHETRAIAEAHKLPVFDKPDSQEICFVPDNDYFRLVQKRTPEAVEPGRIVDKQGNDLGEHDGQQRYTIGQRRGLSISLGHPIYVVGKDAQANTITVGEKEDTLARGLRANEVNWFVDRVDGARDCLVKIRSNGEPVPGRVSLSDEDELIVEFDEPVSAVSPGQAVVCYDGEYVIGGGWIVEAVD